MSIYISLCCLGYDSELIHTIRSAKDNASNPDDIHIGLVCIGKKDFYNKILEKISIYTNIKTEYYEADRDNLGVGFGRNKSADLYDGQDYFLQVDAHSFFSQNWDTIIIDKLNTAIKRTKNEKTIISGFPSRYGYVDDKGNDTFWIDERHRYPFFIKDNYYINVPEKNGYTGYAPAWNDGHEAELGKKFFKKLKKNGAMPLVKISAAFIFGNKNFAKDIHLSRKTVFWDEEIIQTINLIDDGFSLAYVGPTIPIAHMYDEDTVDHRGVRDRVDLWWPEELTEDGRITATINNYLYFYQHKNNQKKIKRYNKYIKMNSMKGPDHNRVFYPTRFINSKNIKDYFPQPHGRGGWFV